VFTGEVGVLLECAGAVDSVIAVMSVLYAILGSCNEAALDQSIEVAGGTVVCCPSLVYLEKPDGNVGVGVAREA
jgi:hypothetical protein